MEAGLHFPSVLMKIGFVPWFILLITGGAVLGALASLFLDRHRS